MTDYSLPPRNPVHLGIVAQALREPASKGYFLKYENTGIRKGERRRENIRRAKALRRIAIEDQNAIALSRRLLECGPDRRCVSGHCAKCCCAAQALFTEIASNLIERTDAKLVVASVVASGLAIMQGDVINRASVFRHLDRQLRFACDAAGITRVFGGFDISANEDEEDRFLPHYQPHAWLFMLASQVERGETAFRKFFPASSSVPRPVKIYRFDGDPRAIAYSFKPNFSRRISLSAKLSRSGNWRRPNTQNRPLRAAQKVELGLALDRDGLDARIFLHGLRFELFDGQLRIKRVDSPERRNAGARPRFSRRGRPLPSRTIERADRDSRE